MVSNQKDSICQFLCDVSSFLDSIWCGKCSLGLSPQHLVEGSLAKLLSSIFDRKLWVNMSLYSASRYAFPIIAHFLPSLMSFVLLPISFNLKSFAHSKTPNANNIDDSVASFNRLLHMHPPPSILQINKILGSIAKAKHYRTVMLLFAQAEFKGFTPDLFILSIFINCYYHMGKMYSAFSLLGKIYKMGLKPSIVTLTTLIKGLCIWNQVGEALDFYDDLMTKGFQLDDVAYGTLINGLCKIGKIRSAIKLVEKIERHIIKPGVVIYTTIIDSLFAKMDMSLRPTNYVLK